MYYSNNHSVYQFRETERKKLPTPPQKLIYTFLEAKAINSFYTFQGCLSA